jgi:hypothetical protein
MLLIALPVSGAVYLCHTPTFGAGNAHGRYSYRIQHTAYNGSSSLQYHFFFPQSVTAIPRWTRITVHMKLRARVILVSTACHSVTEMLLAYKFYCLILLRKRSNTHQERLFLTPFSYHRPSECMQGGSHPRLQTQTSIFTRSATQSIP